MDGAEADACSVIHSMLRAGCQCPMSTRAQQLHWKAYYVGITAAPRQCAESRPVPSLCQASLNDQARLDLDLCERTHVPHAIICKSWAHVSTYRSVHSLLVIYPINGVLQTHAKLGARMQCFCLPMGVLCRRMRWLRRLLASCCLHRWHREAPLRSQAADVCDVALGGSGSAAACHGRCGCCAANECANCAACEYAHSSQAQTCIKSGRAA